MNSLEFQLSLWKNIALLSVAVFVYGLSLGVLRKLPVRTRGLILGFLFGVIAFFGMLMPVQVVPGVLVDGRVILTGLSGFFGGGAAAIVCAAIVSAYRAYLGGAGQWAGIGAIVTAALLGSFFRWLRLEGRVAHLTVSLFLLGSALAVEALLWTFALPMETALAAIGRFLIPIPVAYVLGTILCGHVFLFESNRQESRWALKEAKAKAEEASRLKGLFVANMSHEIRTPLTSIVGAIEVLAVTPLSDEQRQFVNILRRGSHTLLSLVEDILDLSKIEAGVLELELGPVSLRDLAAEVLELFALRAKQKGLDLRTDIPSSLPSSVLADRKKLMQVLTNLLGNAIKFTESGSVTLRLVEKKSARNTTVVEFSVQDTGPGIGEGERERVFFPFHQGESSASARQQGTGLGLTIAQQFVQAMGGSLHLESRVGRGTCLSFVLTLERASV